MIKKSLLYLIFLFSLLFAQITVSINSGDPAYPFPQFQAYENPTETLHNLGTRNSVGVTHAEMEQTIRDAYQIMMNRAEKPGGGVGGIDYIYYNSEPSCTEGDGYAMLAAVAMADKETFDGLWLWIHDNAMNNVKRYIDCEESSPGYRYSQLPGWTNTAGDNSAADGDFDIGLALLCAYYQWGEFMGIDDACGNPISYKKAALDFLKAMTDTLPFADSNNSTYVCGDIGIDGYFKGGDSWPELTDWATDPSQSGFSFIPEARGPTNQYFDYTAPGYFYQFRKFLIEEDSSTHAWNIMQYYRAEASSDWLIGQLYSQDERNIPFAGHVSIGSNNIPSFENVSSAEDIRLPWRTILNYMWHGQPAYTWDPQSHTVIENEPNTFLKDMALRYSRFLWDNRQDPWNNPCETGANEMFEYWGPQVLWNQWNLDGSDGDFFFINWIHGTGSPSAIVSQDFDLMADMFRKCEIEWDVSTPGDGYLTSTPFYFHGWFRLLGLLTLSGNYPAPSELKPIANMKVYLDINKTFGFEGDTVTYTIDYRNFGSLDASDVVIVDTLHQDFEFISATGGGTHDPATNIVTWDIGTVSGFKTSSGIEPTKGQFELKVKVSSATQKQYRNSVTITCSNGTGWTSSEYPNNITAVMERNYLDIAKRALVIEKTASSPEVNPGNEVQFNIEFENTSDAGWIDGGRSDVQFAFSSSPDGTSGTMNNMRVRLFHDADEAYIDFGNYRVSYFLFDAGLTCYAGTDGCQTGWEIRPTIVEGINQDEIKVFQENITPGEDSNGKWNQRIVVQFSDPQDPDRTEKLTTINHHLSEYFGMQGRIHRGGTSPLRLVWYLNPSSWTDVEWDDDWSYDPEATDDDGGRYWPVTPDWTDPDNPAVPVTRWNPKGCDEASHTVDNVLVEEWDGYTWRRVAGNGPLPGRDAINVVIKDTIPPGFSFDRFEGEPPLGIEPTVSDNIITWKIPKLQIQKKGTISYVATASGACPMQDKTIMTRAWISADKESPFSDSVAVTVTCDSVEAPLPPPTTMYKYADKDIYRKGDTIDYTIAYKQTHGSVFTDASDADEWTDFIGNGKLDIDSDGTINYDIRDAGMVHEYSYGINGTIGGTITPATYTEFSIVVRQSGSDYVEIRFKNDWGDVKIDFYNNSTQAGSQQSFSYTDYPGPFDFKIELSEDTISFWAGDTSSTTAPLPNIRQTGIDVREGYAGVMSRNDPGTSLSNWYSHFDVAYDVKIHDNLPSGLSLISADGEISTGHLAGTQLTGTNSDGVIEWQVVSGDTYLDYNDSVTLNIKAICEDFPRDSIVNTAFTNLRGYPQNRIAARVSSPVFIEAGPPHHLDIIVDTTAIKLREDELFNTLTMDQATKVSTVYAVVRDSSGNLIDYVSSAAWESRNQTIVTASGQSDPPGSCVITKTGEGSVIVVVSQSGLLPDSIEINAVAPPPWPVIISAVMTDENGDIIPDQMRIMLNSTLKEDQSIIRVIIEYEGEVYNIPFANTSLEDTFLTVPFLSKSGKDPVPEGNVTVVLSVDGSEKRESRKFTDGVGPAISTAMLGENIGEGFDTLSIFFTEGITISALEGQTLQLISKTTGDTSLLTVEKIISSQNDQNATVTVSTQGTRPSEHDSLRLVPGNQGSIITDMAGNMVHPFNIPALIMAKPAQFSGGYYVDSNADGVVDSLFMHFSKNVNRSGMLLTLSWGGVRLNKLTSDHFTYGSDSSIIIVSLPDSFKTSSGIKTSGNMYPLIEFDLFPDDSRNGEIADSVAPVITDAVFTSGISFDESTVKPDTLRVIFSEDVSVESSINPFLLNREGITPYTFNLELISCIRNVAFFLVSDINGVEYPLSGDSIWINPISAVKDLNTYQNNSDNRRVYLTVQKPDIKWDVVVAPNPYCPDAGSGDANGVKIKIVTPSNTRLPIVLHETHIDIYDAVGNRILTDGRFVKTADGIEYTWDGRNKRGRKVGSGTYLGIVSVDDEGYKGRKRVKIGIRWK